MARVLLIDPPWYALQNVSYDKVSYGLASCAGVLRDSRHDCIIYNGEFGLVADQPFKQDIITDFDLYRSNLEDISPLWKKTWQNIKSIINDFQPAVVGITIPTAKFTIAIKIARYIKNEFPHLMIVAGGPHPTILPRETLQEPSLDVVVKKEGEFTLLALVNAFERNEAFEKIAGIAFKRDGVIQENPDREYINDLDSLPFPAWDCTYRFTEHAPNSFGTIFTSRGCPYQCVYCASNKIWSRKTRYMSAARVIAELIDTARLCKATDFRFADDTLTLDKNRVMDICDRIKHSGLNIRWMCDMRADSCDYKILKIMKSAGCFRVNIGVESGNPEVLRYMKKAITLDHVYRAFAIVKKAKLESLAYFMIGFPNETLGQIKDTIKLIHKLKSDHTCVCIVTPYPGTQLYSDALEGGIIPPVQDWSLFFHHSPKMGLTRLVDDDTLIAIIKELQEKFDRDQLWRYQKSVFKRRLKLLFSNPAAFIGRVFQRIMAFFH